MTSKVKQFLVESKTKISFDIQNVLRHLYFPIIGAKASMFYLTLMDKIHSGNRSYFSVSALAAVNGLLLVEVDEIRAILEAIGLLQSYLSANEETILFRLIEPQNPQAFFKNDLLSKLLSKRIGELELEKLEMQYKVRKFDKDEFHNISSKYHDVYDLSEVNKFESKVLTTRELPTLDVNNKEEAIEKLSSNQFIKYLTGHYPNEVVTSKINGFLSTGLADASINLILDYSFEVNGKIVFAHVAQIVNSFTSVGSNFSFEAIKIELENAMNSKKANMTTSMNTLLEDEEPKSSSLFDEDDSSDLFAALRSL